MKRIKQKIIYQRLSQVLLDNRHRGSYEIDHNTGRDKNGPDHFVFFEDGTYIGAKRDLK